MVITPPTRQKPQLPLSEAVVSTEAQRSGETCFSIPPTQPASAVKRAQTSNSPGDHGFTLLELMIVMVIIGILAAIAIPAYTRNIRAANEAVLKEDLHVMRQAIDSYTVDKAKAPESLDDLVQSGYLKTMPIDPMTKRSDTWMPVQADTMMDLDQTESGINDVHSGSQQTASDGTSYNTW